MNKLIDGVEIRNEITLCSRLNQKQKLFLDIEKKNSNLYKLVNLVDFVSEINDWIHLFIACVLFITLCY